MTKVPTTIKNKTLVERRRKQIILAAIKLFAQKGFHKTNLRELAEAAGISTGNIYDYVGSKEDIFYLIHSYAAAHVSKKLDQSVLGVKNPIEKLRRMVRAEFKVMDQWADAIMLLYQETHILSPNFLHQLLEKERDHVSKFEVIIEECIDSGLLQQCNVRVTANLIKSMVDTWVIKRWDIRGYATQLETENTILKLVFNGLGLRPNIPTKAMLTNNFLRGKNILLVNGETIIGDFMKKFMLSNGANLSIYHDNLTENGESIQLLQEKHEELKKYSLNKNGPFNNGLFDKIEEENGAIDIYIHELGAGNINENANINETRVAEKLDRNIRCAMDTGPYIAEKMSERSCGKIIYISPWKWDYYGSKIRHQIVTASAATLVINMAIDVAKNGVNVNCVVPGYIKCPRPSPIEKALTTKLEETIPLGCLGELQDVADAIMFLASDMSKYVTGQEININGGCYNKE